MHRAERRCERRAYQEGKRAFRVITCTRESGYHYARSAPAPVLRVHSLSVAFHVARAHADQRSALPFSHETPQSTQVARLRTIPLLLALLEEAKRETRSVPQRDEYKIRRPRGRIIVELIAILFSYSARGSDYA